MISNTDIEEAKAWLDREKSCPENTTLQLASRFAGYRLRVIKSALRRGREEYFRDTSTITWSRIERSILGVDTNPPTSSETYYYTLCRCLLAFFEDAVSYAADHVPATYAKIEHWNEEIAKAKALLED